jgi:hypothetical protein
VAQTRQSFRRVRRFSRVARVAVLLDEQLPSPVTEEQVKSLGASAVATSLAEAAAWIDGRVHEVQEAGMVPAPVPEREAERLAELARLHVLDSTRDPALDAITARLREALGTPVALVSLVDDKRQFWKSACGLPPALDQAREAPRATSICGHVVAGNDTLVVEDTLRDPRFAGNPFLREHGIRFYAGAPLRTRAGLAIGSLCVLDVKPRRIGDSERQMLAIIADQAVRELETQALARSDDNAASERAAEERDG